MNIYQVNTDAGEAAKALLNSTHLEKLWDKLLNLGYEVGVKIITCIIIYYIGRFIIRWIGKFVQKLLETRKVDKSVKTFLGSLVNITLTLMLLMSIIGVLGIQTTSFAALIASAGLAVGMAMKDNLANFAGGVMILFNKPIKVGDYIVAQGEEGSVKSIGILYTILSTADHKTVYIPNGKLSTGNILNHSTQKERRVDITVSVVIFGTSFTKIKEIVNEFINSKPEILRTPEPFVGISKLNKDYTDIVVKVWAKSPDYWPVYYYLNETIYEKLTQEGII